MALTCRGRFVITGAVRRWYPFREALPVTAPAAGAPVVLRVDALEKSFGGRVLLRDVDFALRGGEMTVILGRQGAGKTVLARILCGQHLPDRGRVLRAGRVPPPAGLGLGLGVTATLERDLALRAAAHGVNTRDYLRAVVGVLGDAAPLSRPFSRLDGAQRGIVTYAASYLLPSAAYLADNNPVPMTPMARPRIEPLFEAVRRRSAILWLTAGTGSLREYEPDHVLMLEHGRLRRLESIEEAEAMFRPPRTHDARMGRRVRSREGREGESPVPEPRT